MFSLPLTSCLSAPKPLPRPLELWCSACPADDDNSAAVHTHTHTPNLKTHSSVELFGLGERVRAACELVNLAPAPSTDIKMYNIRPAEREGGAFNALRNSPSFFFGCLSPVDFIYRFYELCVKVWAPYFSASSVNFVAFLSARLKIVQHQWIFEGWCLSLWVLSLFRLAPPQLPERCLVKMSLYLSPAGSLIKQLCSHHLRRDSVDSADSVTCTV